MEKTIDETVENLIEFKTVERPLGIRGNFPYAKIIKGLQDLKVTKALTFSTDYLTDNKLTTLRFHARKQGIDGYIRRVKEGKNVVVWLQERT